MSLRTRLQTETLEPRSELERAFSTLDVASAPGLGMLLLTHRLALATVAQRSRAAPPTLRAEIGDQIAMVRSDLAALGLFGAPMPMPGARGNPLNPVAVEYVLATGRQGLTRLQLAWARSGSPMVQAAGRFLNARPRLEQDRAMSLRLAVLPATGDAADSVVSDALRIHAIYRHALHRITKLSEELGRVDARREMGV